LLKERIGRHQELLHLTDAAGLSLAMLCCIELGALAKAQQDTSGILKLLDAGERQGRLSALSCWHHWCKAA
jgi:hypothetical protein